jgi:hypothetical protein
MRSACNRSLCVAVLTPLLLLALTGASAGLAPAAAARGQVVQAPVSAGADAPQLLAFRGRLGGGGLFGRSRSFGGSRYGSRHPILRHIGRALFFTWLLHAFFSSGGLSILIWLVIIGLVVHLVRRRRRPAYRAF